MSNLKLPNMSYRNLYNLTSDVTKGDEIKLAYATTVRRSEHDEQAIQVLHHGNLIAVMFPTFIRLSNGGWDSKTTAMRLNRIVRDNNIAAHVSLRKGDTVLSIGDQDIALSTDPVVVTMPPVKKRRGTIPMVALAFTAFAAIAITGCTDNGSTASYTPPSTTQAPIVNVLPSTAAPGDDNGDGVIDEDESGWDCATMGNRICGPANSPEQQWTETLSANGFSFDSPAKAITFGRLICQMKVEEQPDSLVIQKINSIVYDSTTARGRGHELLNIAKRTICKGYEG